MDGASKGRKDGKRDPGECQLFWEGGQRDDADPPTPLCPVFGHLQGCREKERVEIASVNDATTSKETCSIFAGLLSAEARRSNIRDVVACSPPVTDKSYILRCNDLTWGLSS